jgi:FkbM family methyltransferase
MSDTIKQINGWNFPAGDIGPSTWADCEWGEPILNTAMFEQILLVFEGRDRQHALDIGANIGYVTSWLGKRWPRVTSFEPTPNTYECLQLNCTRSHIRLHNFGLSNINGNLCFATSDAKPDQNQIITNESKLRKHWGVTRVPTRRLDSFNFSTVDLIKIDVEGHEHQVVNGALKTIQRCRPAIVVEISYEGKLLDHVLSADHKKTVGLIESLGYQTVWQHKHDWLLLPDDWYSR